MTVSWKGRENPCIQLVKLLYCKLKTNGKQLLTVTLVVRPGGECVTIVSQLPLITTTVGGPKIFSENLNRKKIVNSHVIFCRKLPYFVLMQDISS